jgi:DNA polymerase-3 subunit epsilon
MTKITCIDFETANPFWGSICSIGLVAIEDGKIVHTLNSLIKPHAGYDVFNRDNIRVHGIKPEMVKDAPEFDVIYPQIKPFIENRMVAAHNSSFDIVCLKDVLTLYNIPIPAFDYICTCEIARKSWAGLKNYKLKTVGTFLGHTFKHHDAGEDALASATIVLKAMEQKSLKSINELAINLGVKTGSTSAGEIHILSSIKREQKKADSVDARSIVPESRNFDTSHPFYNREIVFTGKFSNDLNRRQTMQMAANAGARLSNYVRQITDFVVQGAKGDGFGGVSDSSKTTKAKKYNESGSRISIISEAEFLELINQTKIGKTV